MFWSSVWHGFKVLAHWEVWCALVLYGIATLGWLWFIGRVIGEDESGKRQVTGCVTHAIGGTLYQGVLQTLMVVWLMPIMLGGDDALAFRYVPDLMRPILVAAIVSTVVVLILSIIPVLGSILDEIPGLSAFAQGLIIFRLFSAAYLERAVGMSGGEGVSIYPSFWHSAGYFAIALVFTGAVLFGLTALAQRVMKNENDSDSLLFLSIPAFMRLAGLLPLFMYAGYVAQMLRQLSL